MAGKKMKQENCEISFTVKQFSSRMNGSLTLSSSTGTDSVPLLSFFIPLSLSFFMDSYIRWPKTVRQFYLTSLPLFLVTYRLPLNLRPCCSFIILFDLEKREKEEEGGEWQSVHFFSGYLLFTSRPSFPRVHVIMSWVTLHLWSSPIHCNSNFPSVNVQK